MNCKRLDELRNSGCTGEAAFGSAAREHLKKCDGCRELQAWWDSTDSTFATVPQSVQGEIGRRILCDLRPVLPLPSDRALIAVLVSLVMLAVGTGVWCLGLAGWRLFAPWRAGIVFSLLSGDIVLISHVVVRQMMPGARQSITPRAAMAGVFLFLLAAFVFILPYHSDPEFASKGLKCWALGITVAAGAALLFLPLLRRGARLSPKNMGAATGFLSGLTSLVVLEIYCPFQDRGHVGFWHLGALATAMFLGRVITVEWVAFRDRQRR